MGKTEPEADRRVKIKTGAHSHLGCLAAGFWYFFCYSSNSGCCVGLFLG